MMIDHHGLIAQDAEERRQALRGACDLFDGTHLHVPPVRAGFADNGTVKFVKLLDIRTKSEVWLQGEMVKQLYWEWVKRFGTGEST